MNKNTDYKKVETIIGTVLFLLFALFIVLKIYTVIREENKEEELLSKEYKNVKLQDDIYGVVVSTYYPASWRGWEILQYVKLDNGEGYLIKIKRNLTPKDTDFGEIVRNGVVLNKNSASDTLTLINGDATHKYLIFTDE